MTKQKKSGRITLRVSSDVHQQLEDVAEDLGLDVNGLLNLLISKALGPIAAEARLCRVYQEELKKEGGFVPLFLAWQKAYPRVRRKDFLVEFHKYTLGEPSQLDGLEGDEASTGSQPR
jgi:hypothetical protein